MNYKVIHDIPGRIPLRCGKDAFTLWNFIKFK